MVELRWTLPEGTTTDQRKLQFRVHLPTTDIGGHLCPGDWTQWQDVPLVIIPNKEKARD